MKAITTKYIGCTSYKPSRIKATDGDNSVTVSYDHALNASENHLHAARMLISKLGWNGDYIQGGTKDGYVFVESTGPRTSGKGA